MTIVDQDSTDVLLKQVSQACNRKTRIRIEGAGTKSWLTDTDDTLSYEVLSLAQHTGIINYEPAELVLRARSGTPVREIEALLSSHGQTLAFEPPEFAVHDTLGGVIACGLSGPARPYLGAARDFVLGTTLINGRAEHLKFGGNVMKNVAGYDLSRLQAGAMGSLGVLLEIALKILPKPEHQLTLQRKLDQEHDLSGINRLQLTTLPVTASAIWNNQQWIRLSGTEPAVREAADSLGGDIVDGTDDLWRSLKNHTHAFFQASSRASDSLWRLSLPPTAPNPGLKGRWLYEWGGAQRWLWTAIPAAQIFQACSEIGGHATCYIRGTGFTASRWQPLAPGLAHLQSRLRNAFDPDQLFDSGQFHRWSSTSADRGESPGNANGAPA